jgi:hypothetical protein
MYHSFDTEHARLYGLAEAVVIYNLQFWIVRNRANGEHFHDGRTWSYNSVRAFEKVFDYLSPKQIRGALERLEEKGVLVTGRYSDDARDRTKWYAFSDEKRFLDGVNPHSPSRANASDQGGETDSPSGANARAGRGKSLIRTDVNANKKPDTVSPPRSQGTRLSEGWVLTLKWARWALEDPAVNKAEQWTEEHLRLQADKFRDHWHAKSGKDARKVDWFATWRNWCRDPKAAMPAARRSGGGAWWLSPESRKAKALEVGVGEPNPGESDASYQSRIQAAIDNGGKPPAPRPVPVTPLDPVPVPSEPAERGSDLSRAATSAAIALLRQKNAGGASA